MLKGCLFSCPLSNHIKPYPTNFFFELVEQPDIVIQLFILWQKWHKGPHINLYFLLVWLVVQNNQADKSSATDQLAVEMAAWTSECAIK